METKLADSVKDEIAQLEKDIAAGMCEADAKLVRAYIEELTDAAGLTKKDKRP